MKVFDYHCFLPVSVTAIQAQDIAKVADSVLNKASFVLYGRYLNGEYIDFSGEQKPGDTHVLLAYGPSRMPSKSSSKSGGHSLCV